MLAAASRPKVQSSAEGCFLHSPLSLMIREMRVQYDLSCFWSNTAPISTTSLGIFHIQLDRRLHPDTGGISQKTPGFNNPHVAVDAPRPDPHVPMRDGPTATQ